MLPVDNVYPSNTDRDRTSTLTNEPTRDGGDFRIDSSPGSQGLNGRIEEAEAKSTQSHRACAVCQRLKIRCFVTEQGGPCRRCATLNHECIFEKPDQGERSSHTHELLERFERERGRTLDTALRSIDITSGMVSRSPSPAGQATSASTPVDHATSPPLTWTSSDDQLPLDDINHPLELAARINLAGGEAREADTSVMSRPCTSCRRLRVRCSRAEQGGPCEGCVSANRECVFEESTWGSSSNPSSIVAQSSAQVHSTTAFTEDPSPQTDPKVEDLVATLQTVFSNREEYKQLLSHRTSNAQGILDMFQQLLDVLNTSHPKFRSDLIVASQRLAGKSGLYPMCFELKDITTVGESSVSNGAFADIYEGTFQGRPVCLKTIRLDQKTDIQHFLKVCSKEAILWGQLSHPNLLPFYGIYRFRHRISLVSPWMEHGDINSYLRQRPSANRVMLARDVAEGLHFLHSNGIIHGDLKGPNILVNDLERACVADFGLSSISDPGILAWTSQSSVASKGGSVRWQAPELFDPESDEHVHNTQLSDVYAWACVAYEIFTGQVPFSHLLRDTAVLFKVINGERPPRPTDSSLSWSDWGLTENIWTLMEDCWKAQSTSRPTVEQIIERLGSEMGEGRTDTNDSRENTEWTSNALSPAQFREMARVRLGLQEVSVQALQALLDTS